MNAEALVEPWLQYLEMNRGRSRGTAVKYGQYLRRLCSWFRAREEGERDPLRATRDDLELYAGLVMHQEGLTPRSRRALVAAIRGWFAWLEERGHLASNPAARLPYPSMGRRLPIPMEAHHLEAMLKHCDVSTLKGVRDAALLMVLAGCGLRVTGLVGLNQEDLRWRLEKGEEKLAILTREKGRKERLVPAPWETAVMLHAYLGHPELAEIDRTLPDGNHVLWVSLRNRLVPEHEYRGEARRLAVRSVYDMMDELGARAGVPKPNRHPHAVRHLYGTELAEAGVDLLERQALMGHTDPRSTQIYTSLAMRRLEQAVERGNPLARIHTPVSDLARALRSRPSGVRAAPSGG